MKHEIYFCVHANAAECGGMKFTSVNAEKNLNAMICIESSNRNYASIGLPALSTFSILFSCENMLSMERERLSGHPYEVPYTTHTSPTRLGRVVCPKDQNATNPHL